MNLLQLKMRNKGYLQISFAWLFAIIVGAFILFLAIYASTKLIQTEQTTIDAKTGKQIGILLNPLETSFETVQGTFFIMPVDTRIYNKCGEEEDFGKQIIQISQKSLNKWTETDIDVNFQNKYIFSEKEVEGRKFYVFSKPFEFPFKVANLIYMISSKKNYCFVDSPEEVEDEIQALNQENLLSEKELNEEGKSCPEKSIKICFEAGNCEIYVDYNEFEKNGQIRKEGDVLYFEEDALMYAAIFSDKDVYDCQTERLMKRMGTLALLYDEKASFVSQKGCYSNLNLRGLMGAENPSSISSLVREIKEENEKNWGCKLW